MNRVGPWLSPLTKYNNLFRKCSEVIDMLGKNKLLLLSLKKTYLWFKVSSISVSVLFCERCWRVFAETAAPPPPWYCPSATIHLMFSLRHWVILQLADCVPVVCHCRAFVFIRADKVQRLRAVFPNQITTIWTQAWFAKELPVERAGMFRVCVCASDWWAWWWDWGNGHTGVCWRKRSGQTPSWSAFGALSWE